MLAVSSIYTSKPNLLKNNKVADIDFVIFPGNPFLRSGVFVVEN